MSTLGELDDIGADCLEAGSNLEVRLVRTMPVEPSKVVEAACEATGAHAPCS